MKDLAMTAFAVVLFGTLPVLFVVMYILNLMEEWREGKGGIHHEALASKIWMRLQHEIGRLGGFLAGLRWKGASHWSSFQRSIVLMIFSFALVLAAYYLMSPYQTCMRSLKVQMSHLKGKDNYREWHNRAVGVCLKQTNW